MSRLSTWISTPGEISGYGSVSTWSSGLLPFLSGLPYAGDPIMPLSSLISSATPARVSTSRSTTSCPSWIDQSIPSTLRNLVISALDGPDSDTALGTCLFRSACAAGTKFGSARFIDVAMSPTIAPYVVPRG